MFIVLYCNDIYLGWHTIHYKKAYFPNNRCCVLLLPLLIIPELMTGPNITIN